MSAKYVVLRVDGSACRVLVDRAGRWAEHETLDGARAAARVEAERDGMQMHQYYVIAVYAEAHCAYDARGVPKVVERDL